MQRLTQLINDLLNFSRYQSGLQKLELAPCALDDLFERAQPALPSRRQNRSS
jgi:NtrC-family two-component system sensor histidine kinase KinB